MKVVGVSSSNWNLVGVASGCESGTGVLVVKWRVEFVGLLKYSPICGIVVVFVAMVISSLGLNCALGASEMRPYMVCVCVCARMDTHDNLTVCTCLVGVVSRSS